MRRGTSGTAPCRNRGEGFSSARLEEISRGLRRFPDSLSAMGYPAIIVPVSFDFQRAVNQTMKIIQKTQNTSGGEQHDSNQDDTLNDEADFSISGK